MVPHFKQSLTTRKGNVGRIPPMLEFWARENGLQDHRWLEIIAPEYRVEGNILFALEEILPFILQYEGYRYFAGVSTHPLQQQPTCFWYGIEV